ncbi:hypothetical protein Trydic_g23824 [Trypoxylus dichotomus]
MADTRLKIGLLQKDSLWEAENFRRRQGQDLPISTASDDRHLPQLPRRNPLLNATQFGTEFATVTERLASVQIFLKTVGSVKEPVECRLMSILIAIIMNEIGIGRLGLTMVQ